MNRYIYILIIILIVVVSLFTLRGPIAKFAVSAYIEKELDADVNIEKLRVNYRGKITLENTTLKNSNGLDCSIESAVIDYDIIFSISKGLKFDFNLYGVRLSDPDSKIINALSKSLSLKPLDVLDFSMVTGKFIRTKETLEIRSLNAKGKLLRIFADGTIVGDKTIDCNFKMLLSDEVVSEIPDSIRKVFFTSDGSWSEVELYLSGDLEHPSVNLTTDLFKLSVR